MGAENGTMSDADGWTRTVEEMRAMAARLGDAGWEVTTVRAGDTAPEPPGAGETDRFGLVFTVPGEAEGGVRSVLRGSNVEEFAVHRRVVGSTMFLVTEFRDPGTEAVLFVAGAVDLDDAAELETAARERGEMYTHVQLLDWTHLGSVRHDDPGAFFPDGG